MNGSHKDSISGRNPGSICYDKPGTYTIRLIVTSLCGADSLDQKIHIIVPAINAGNDTIICNGDSVILYASGAEQYRWETPDGLSCTDCPNPTLRPTKKSIYVVRGWNALGCSALDSITVDVLSVDAGRDTTASCRRWK